MKSYVARIDELKTLQNSRIDPLMWVAIQLYALDQPNSGQTSLI